MRCNACETEINPKLGDHIEWCWRCGSARDSAYREAGIRALERWDREHRKPKEEVIEVEVPAAWLQWFPSRDMSQGQGPTRVEWRQFTNPPGRLVLKARKE